MKLSRKILFVTLLGLTIGTSQNSNACTDFKLTGKDGTIIVTRSMEYALDFHSNLRTSTRNREFIMTAPDNKPAMKWKAKYGYVYLDGLDTDIAVDGMNEKGLSFEALYLPTLAQYQEIPAGKEAKALPYINFGDWVLSSFDTVDQVKDAVKNIYVFAQDLPNLNNMVFPLHYAIYDASGKGIVVEYIDGKLHVYDNIGVMTNSPAYSWHLTNLNNYVHLTPTNPNPIVENGVKFAATGQGYGMIGLPGDISPPSRFVKVATLLHVLIPTADAGTTLNAAEHVINNVDIPLGLAREPSNGAASNELTQWVVFKDLTHKVFYYRTYNNLTLHSVSFDKLNFAANAQRLKMPIASPETIIDMNEEFLKTHQS